MPDDDVKPLTTGTGVNVSKENLLAVTSPPTGVDVSKIVVYSVVAFGGGETLAAALTETASIPVRTLPASDTLAAAFTEVATLNTGTPVFPGSDTLAAALTETATLLAAGKGLETLAAALTEANALSIKNPGTPGTPGAGFTPIDCLQGPGGTPDVPPTSGGGTPTNYVF